MFRSVLLLANVDCFQILLHLARTLQTPGRLRMRRIVLQAALPMRNRNAEVAAIHLHAFLVVLLGDRLAHVVDARLQGCRVLLVRALGVLQVVQRLFVLVLGKGLLRELEVRIGQIATRVLVLGAIRVDEPTTSFD